MTAPCSSSSAAEVGRFPWMVLNGRVHGDADELRTCCVRRADRAHGGSASVTRPGEAVRTTRLRIGGREALPGAARNDIISGAPLESFRPKNYCRHPERLRLPSSLPGTMCVSAFRSTAACSAACSGGRLTGVDQQGENRGPMGDVGWRRSGWWLKELDRLAFLSRRFLPAARGARVALPGREVVWARRRA